MSPAVSILRSFDEAHAPSYWCDWLGFAIDWEHRFEPDLPLYMGLRRDGCIIHLSEHHGDATPGSAIRIETPDIDALLSDLHARPRPGARPAIGDQSWGASETRLTDPSGNRVAFWQARADCQPGTGFPHREPGRRSRP